MALVIKGSSSGQITLDVPASAGTNTLTIPALTGTVGISAGGFRAQRNADDTVSASTYTKLQFDVEEFDINSEFDHTTNFRFTPQTAGYYLIGGGFRGESTGTNILAIYFNGSLLFRKVTEGSKFVNLQVPIAFNGSSDYVEAFGFTTGTSFSGYNTGDSYFSGMFMRSL